MQNKIFFYVHKTGRGRGRINVGQNGNYNVLLASRICYVQIRNYKLCGYKLIVFQHNLVVILVLKFEFVL